MTEQTPRPATFLEKIEKSSQVRVVTYHADVRELRVIFKGSAPPVVYAYKDVEPELYARLLAAPSIGSFLHTDVKKHYPPFVFDKRALTDEMEDAEHSKMAADAVTRGEIVST